MPWEITKRYFILVVLLCNWRCFQAHISSTFLYNREPWYNKKSITEEIDAFHRKQLRFATINYPKIIKYAIFYAMNNKCGTIVKNYKNDCIGWNSYDI